MGQVYVADCNILKCSLLCQCVRSCVLCVHVATRLCTLRTGSYTPVLHIGLYTGGHDTIIIQIIMEMPLYSRSTTVIHHASPWLIRHDTLSVRVRQSSGNRSGSGINCMHANDRCGESGVFVIRYHNTVS